MIPFYQFVLSKNIWNSFQNLLFQKLLTQSGDRTDIFWKFYSPADTLWSAKSVGQRLDYTSEQPYQVSIHRSVLVKLLASLLIKTFYLGSRKVRLASCGAVV